MLLWGNHLLNLNKAAVADGAHEHPLLGGQRLHGAHDTLCTSQQNVRMTCGCGGVYHSNAHIPAVGFIPHSVPKHVAQAILKQQPGLMSATLMADLLIVALQMLQTMKSEALFPESGSECV